jgi:hypothetical protein
MTPKRINEIKWHALGTAVKVWGDWRWEVGMLAVNGDPNNDETWTGDDPPEDDEDDDPDASQWRLRSIDAETGVMTWQCWCFQRNIDPKVTTVGGVPDLRDDQTYQLVRQRLSVAATADSLALLDRIDHARLINTSDKTEAGGEANGRG